MNVESATIIGGVGRVTSWKRALTNDELRHLRENPPTGNESDLIAAYTMHKRKEDVLVGVKGIDGKMNNITWCDELTYTWGKKILMEVIQN